MSKRSSTSVTKAPAPSSAPPQPARPEAPRAASLLRHRLIRLPWVVWLAAAVLLAGAGWVVWASYGHAPDPREGQALCERFARLRSAGDPAADDLLGPAPAVPADSISQEEADRIDAEAFLRTPGLHVLKVRADRSEGDGGRFILTTEGGAAGPMLRVRSGDKVDRVQKVVTNPELVVEVRGGKLFGVRAQVPRP